MPIFYYRIISGSPNFTAHIEPQEVEDQTHSSTGTYSFTVPSGIYSLIVTDALGCIIEIDNINVIDTTTTTTTTTTPENAMTLRFVGTNIGDGTFEFDDNDENTIVDYTIDWGDGIVESGTNSHTYLSDNTYNITIYFTNVTNVYTGFIQGYNTDGSINYINVNSLSNLNSMWLDTVDITSIDYSNNSNITTLGFAACNNMTTLPEHLLTVTDLYINTCTNLTALPILENLQTLDVNTSSMTDFDFTIYSTLNSLQISYTTINTILYPSTLTNLGYNNITINTVDVTGLLSIQTLSLSNVTATSVILDEAVSNYNILNIISFPNLTTLDLKNIPIISYLNIQYSTSLTSINNFTDSANCRWNFAGNALTETIVNSILVESNSKKGFISSPITLTINGGTNAAPTGAGLTAKSALIANNWLVNSN